MVDGGYTGKPLADEVKRILNAEVEVAKHSELHTFAVIPKRWGSGAVSTGWKNAAAYGKTVKA